MTVTAIAERADNVKKRNYFTQYSDTAQTVLNTLLDKYADAGVQEIENKNVLKVAPLPLLADPLKSSGKGSVNQRITNSPSAHWKRKFTVPLRKSVRPEPENSVRPVLAEGRKLQAHHQGRANHPSTPLRVNGDRNDDE